MEVKEIISLAISILTLGSLIFAAYHFFKNPQISLEKKQALNEERDKYKAEKGTVALLEEKIKWIQEQTDKKFCDMAAQLEKSYLLAANHTHTVDTKVDKLIERQDRVESEIVKLSTIIEERIPKKV